VVVKLQVTRRYWCEELHALKMEALRVFEDDRLVPILFPKAFRKAVAACEEEHGLRRGWFGETRLKVLQDVLPEKEYNKGLQGVQSKEGLSLNEIRWISGRLRKAPGAYERLAREAHPISREGLMRAAEDAMRLSRQWVKFQDACVEAEGVR
jgi:hypothetical protein